MQISEATHSVVLTPAQEQSDYFRKYCTDYPFTAQLLDPRMSPRNTLVSSFLQSTLASSGKKKKLEVFFFFLFWRGKYRLFCQNACFLSAACHSTFEKSGLGWDYFWLCINPYFTLEGVLRSAGWAVYYCRLRNISPSKTQYLNDQG